MIFTIILILGICEAALLYGLRSFFVGILLDDEMHCGGALVQKNYVLTAAACLAKDVSRYSVRIHRLGLEADFKVDSLILYPGYFSSYKPHNNIALVSFHWLQSDVVKMDLDFSGISAFGYLKVSMLGWGRMYGLENFNHLNLTLFDKSSCVFYCPSVDLDSELCAGNHSEGMSLLDFGSPLIYSNGDIPILVGIHSWAKPSLSYNSFSVFARVSRFSQWIKHIIDPPAHNSLVSFNRYTNT